MSETQLPAIGVPPAAGLDKKSPFSIDLPNPGQLFPSVGQAESLSSQVKQHLSDLLSEPLAPDQDLNIKQAEANRRILMFALNYSFNLPPSLYQPEIFASLNTKELLNHLDAHQLQYLQGALVYEMVKNLHDMDPQNSLGIGGIAYSQSLIDPDFDGPIVDALQQQFMAHDPRFHEFHPIPAALKSNGNIKGTIHVLPYGETHELKGKDKETLLMLADDLSVLFDIFQNNDKVPLPRFIMNSTNSVMGRAAQKYLGAQVLKPGYIEELVGHVAAVTLGQPGQTNSDTVTAFIPELVLRLGKFKLKDLKEGLHKKLAQPGEDYDATLKRIRLDAILYILEKKDVLSHNTDIAVNP